MKLDVIYIYATGFVKSPIILENVKQLAGHDKGRTLKTILATLEELDYDVHIKVLNALDYGLPQKRERVVIVGHRDPIMFTFPRKIEKYKPLTEILEPEDTINPKFIASDYIREKRAKAHISHWSPGIWHENKSGNVTSYPYSCALRAGASYSYLLVDGKRRLTPREMLRLQGFPDWYKVVVSDGQIRKQAGNSVPVTMIKAVCLKLLPFITESISSTMILREPKHQHN